MVIGHQHRNTQRMGALDAGVGGNAVIHGNYHLRAAGVSLIDHFRTQAIAILKTVWHRYETLP